MTPIIIDTNIDNILKKLDFKLANKIDKAVIAKITSAVKKDLKVEVKKLFNGSNKVGKFIGSKITNNNIGIIKARYIAKWQNEGTKDRSSRRQNGFIYFETPEGFVKKKVVKGIVGKKYMELADRWIDGGKYNDLVDKTVDSVLKKVLGDE